MKLATPVIRLGRSAAALIVSAGLLLAALPAAVRAETPPPVIRIGLASAAVGNPPIYTVGSAGLAIHKGWFAEEFKADGTKVEFSYFKGAGPAVNEALTNRQLDFAFQGDLASIVGKAAGLKTRLIAAVSRYQGIYLAVPADSPIRSVKDLRGKRVAIFKGTNVQLPIHHLLEANGLSERDLRAINLDGGSALAALQTRDIDAAFGYVELLRLRDQGAVRIIYASGDDPAAYPRHAHLVVTDDFAQKYPETTTRIVKVLLKAARWSSEEANRSEVYRLWALMGVASAAHWNEEAGRRSLRERASPLLDPYILSHYQKSVDRSFKLRLVRSRFDVQPWVDRRFLDAALKEQHLENYWQPQDVSGAVIATAR